MKDRILWGRGKGKKCDGIYALCAFPLLATLKASSNDILLFFSDFGIDDEYLLDEVDDDDQGYAEEYTMQQLLEMEGQ